MRWKTTVRPEKAAMVVVLYLYAMAYPVASLATTVEGVMGLLPVEERTCVAIWVPIPENQALAGLVWYNNDEMVVYPEILLESGSPDYPVNLDDCQVVAQDVHGLSSGWSTVTFDEVARSLSGGLYVLFRFPEGSEYTADGAGGGAAFGYSVSGDGLSGWISAEGEDWIAFTEPFGFAVEPVYVDASEATITMLGRQAPEIAIQRADLTQLHSPVPNPSNPGTSIRFSLACDGSAELGVYDIRGRCIRVLVDEFLEGGDHDVYWDGCDRSGRSVASGVYFARLSAGGSTMNQKLMIIR